MFFKGSIYITDPCYIAKDDDWMEETGFDTDNYIIALPDFSDYMMESTGEGDGSWSVYEVPSNKKLSLYDLCDIVEDEEQDFSEFKKIGGFCADAGMSCVVYKTEADEYNPDFKNEMANVNKCVALITDFEGEITSYFDDYGGLHFIGVGNKTFFTA